jgi:hypothetical protein
MAECGEGGDVEGVCGGGKSIVLKSKEQRETTTMQSFSYLLSSHNNGRI